MQVWKEACTSQEIIVRNGRIWHPTLFRSKLMPMFHFISYLELVGLRCRIILKALSDCRLWTSPIITCCKVLGVCYQLVLKLVYFNIDWMVQNYVHQMVIILTVTWNTMILDCKRISIHLLVLPMD